VREDRRTTESIMWREILQWANKWSITAESQWKKATAMNTVRENKSESTVHSESTVRGDSESTES
jgi:hypothetical protein